MYEIRDNPYSTLHYDVYFNGKPEAIGVSSVSREEMEEAAARVNADLAQKWEARDATA